MHNGVRYTDPSEHSIQVKVLGLINTTKTHPDIFAIAIPNAGKRGWKTAALLKSEGMLPGAADVCILMPLGKSAWLEMKARKGKQETDQKGFQARCKRLGHPYGVAHSLEEATVFLKQEGIIR